MTPLEDLIQLLKARGVEPTIDGRYGISYIKWKANNTEFMAFEHSSALCLCQMGSVTLTPEEAIRATLGSGTCTVTYECSDDGDYEYGFSCGHSTTLAYRDAPKFCPNCGAKVVDE